MKIRDGKEIKLSLKTQKPRLKRTRGAKQAARSVSCKKRGVDGPSPTHEEYVIKQSRTTGHRHQSCRASSDRAGKASGVEHVVVSWC